MSLTTFFRSTSVCIASVGRPSLIDLVLSLHQYSHNLFDFFVCVPQDVPQDLDERLRRLPSTKVIQASVKNQVFQRHLAISHASRPYILQLDDDITIDAESLCNLFLTHQSLPFGSATSLLLRTHEGRSFFPILPTLNSHNYISNLKSSIIALLLGYPNVSDNKLLYGKISKSGVPIGVPYDPSLGLPLPLQVEFLSGCCMLLPRLFAQLDDYYPFNKGRASLEDLFHSKYLTSRAGLKLYVVPNSYLSLQPPEVPCSDWASLRNLTHTIPRQLKFNRTYGYSFARYLLFFLFYSLSLFLRIFLRTFTSLPSK